MNGGDLRHRRAAGWALAAAILIALCAGAVLIVALGPRAQEGDPTTDLAARLWLAICAGAGLLALLSPLPRSAKGLIVSAAIGAGLLGGAGLVLSHNDFGPLGAVQDQATRTALLTKYGHHWNWVDFAYRGLPVYYPPLSFWILGRIAAFASIAPWKMLKVDVLLTAFLVPVVTWPLWSRLVGRVTAIGAVLGVLAYQSWYRPHAWLGIALFVPWWLWAVLGVGRTAPSTKGRQLGASVLGAAIFCLYYFPFLLGAIHLVVLLALRRPARARGTALAPSDLRGSMRVLGGTVAISSPYWLPILLAISRNGAQVAFNRWYTPDFVDLRFRFLQFDLLGIVLLLGLVYLLVTALRSPVSLALLGLLGAAFAYYLADYVGVLTGFPLLSFQANDVVDLVLATAAGLAAVALVQAAVANQRVRQWTGPPTARAACAVLGVVVAFALAQQALESIPYVKEQQAAEYPAALLSDFRRATDGKAAGSVVLTDLEELPVFEDVYVYNWWNAHYMNPPALFNDRTKLLERLSQETSADAFAIAIAHNRFDVIDYLALRRGPSGSYLYEYVEDIFPRGAEGRRFEYDAQLLTNPLFEQHDTVSMTVFRLDRTKDPLDELRDCPGNPERSSCNVLGVIGRRYSSSLDDESSAVVDRWRTARRHAH